MLKIHIYIIKFTQRLKIRLFLVNTKKATSYHQNESFAMNMMLAELQLEKR